ncbi:MAG: hypothetical protein RMI34_05730 [Chloroherpetonaceae bacterium]|nr:cell wall-active antibiotics response protein [Chloroherpetonaceae bacterium]MDW8019559.1 hypothetical protein [Chloroherpetonaceae bacterium]
MTQALHQTAVFRSRLFAASLLCLVCLSSVSFSQVVRRAAMPLTTEKSIAVQLELGAIRLQLGSQNHGNAFEYEFHSTDTAALTAEYIIRDQVGRLVLQHRSSSDEPKGRRVRFNWRSLFGDDETRPTSQENLLRLLLPTDIPVELDFSVGAASNELDMSGLRVSSLTLSSGACATHLRFNAPNPIPMKRLQLSAGASKLVVAGLSNANFEELDFNGGASDVVLDFSGSELRSSKASISIGAGSVKMLVPKELGVKVKYADNFFSSFKLPEDFMQDGEWFYSGNFSEAKHVLELHISSGVGSVRLRWK